MSEASLPSPSFWTGPRRRPLLGLIPTVLVVFYVHYGITSDASATSYAEIMLAPQSRVGTGLVLAFYKVKEVHEGGFTAVSWGGEAPVVGEVAGLSMGDVISVRGTLLPDYRVQLAEAYVHKWRRLKKIIGLLTTLLVGTLFVRDWRRGHPPGAGAVGG